VCGGYHAFPAVRHRAARAAPPRSLQLLDEGQCLIVFPEGTRVESGVLAEPEPGAGFIAQRCGCPVRPVATPGTRECLPKGRLWPRRVPVTVRFGKPFVVLQRRPTGERVSHEQAAQSIMVAIAELLPAEKRGAFTDFEARRKRLEGVTSMRPSPLQGRGPG